MKKTVFFASLIFLSLVGSGAFAANNGEVRSFNIDPGYDLSARQEVSAVLVQTTPKLYFYIEKNWWDVQNYTKQSEVISNFNLLAQEFAAKIYPSLTSAFGSEWTPGIDDDPKITLLFHLMPEDVGGYFRSADEYLKMQLPDSNEREMLYFPISKISDPQLKTFLAHEFTHLITFNQKEERFNVSEETWLNEGRAEYAITLLGYDSNYEGSNLQRRTRDFLDNPSDSITEWLNKKYDYGSVNLFIQYVVDQYGVKILVDSLKSKSIGIPSLNEALQKNMVDKDFSRIFTDWTIAVFLNNCAIKEEYCYLSANLKNLKINPSLNFLPITGNSSLFVEDVTKNWSGNWQKIIGGNGALKLIFEGLTGLNYKVPYIIQDKDGKFSVNFLTLNSGQKGRIDIADFGSQNRGLIIIPSLQSKISGFDGIEFTYPYSFTASVAENTTTEDELTRQLFIQIASLQQEIARVRAQLDAILNGGTTTNCAAINNNLSFGQSSAEVRCLQEFLKSQGSGIYPEGLITGYFGGLTRSAVIRFQERYSAEILLPLGLSGGSGFVGPATRAKINQIIGS